MEKLFILEWLEARLKDVVEDYNAENPDDPPVSIEVFDPYNSDMDFFVMVRADRPNFNETYKAYEGIYNEYHSRTLQNKHMKLGKPVKRHEDKHKKDWMKKKNLDKEAYDAMKNTCLNGYGEFHASISKTMMFYSIEQMAKLYGQGGRVYTP